MELDEEKQDTLYISSRCLFLDFNRKWGRHLRSGWQRIRGGAFFFFLSFFLSWAMWVCLTCEENREKKQQGVGETTKTEFFLINFPPPPFLSVQPRKAGGVRGEGEGKGKWTACVLMHLHLGVWPFSIRWGAWHGKVVFCWQTWQIWHGAVRCDIQGL